jgi:hypothetical protein
VKLHDVAADKAVASGNGDLSACREVGEVTEANVRCCGLKSDGARTPRQNGISTCDRHGS